MNALRGPEFRRVTALITLVSAGALALAGCGDSLSSKRFARCFPSETAGQQPVDLGNYKIDDPDNIVTLERAIQIHPQLLIDTAGRIHPDPTNPSKNLLSGVIDRAHNNGTFLSGGSNGDGETDYVDNTGDILCETTPFGNPDSKERKVYYDQDGLTLELRVEAALDDIAQTHTVFH
ncbi:MAG TPA: hypothetical protein VFW90_01715 [Candidatus Saccharimonadales bacterium]|nr:hypothetical protein [Candidatus Saccharimonadales bacterium]